jgi:hypothetical protein
MGNTKSRQSRKSKQLNNEDYDKQREILAQRIIENNKKYNEEKMKSITKKLNSEYSSNKFMYISKEDYDKLKQNTEKIINETTKINDNAVINKFMYINKEEYENLLQQLEKHENNINSLELRLSIDDNLITALKAEILTQRNIILNQEEQIEQLLSIQS